MLSPYRDESELSEVMRYVVRDAPLEQVTRPAGAITAVRLAARVWRVLAVLTPAALHV